MQDITVIDDTLLITIASAIGAFIAILAVALPLLKRAEKKKREDSEQKETTFDLHDTIKKSRWQRQKKGHIVSGAKRSKGEQRGAKGSE